MSVNKPTGDNMDQQTTGPDCLTSDLAGLAAREAGAPARGPTRIEEIRARLTPRRAEDAAAWDPDADGCVCAECMKSIRLLEECEWNNGEDVCDECAARLLGGSRADVGYLLNELAEARRLASVNARTALGMATSGMIARTELQKVTADRDAALTALAEAEAEINRGRPGYSWISDEALASLTEMQERTERTRHALAVEQGREGPKGWRWDGARWHKMGAASLYRDSGRWEWVVFGDPEIYGVSWSALEAIEAAERVLKGP